MKFFYILYSIFSERKPTIDFMIRRKYNILIYLLLSESLIYYPSNILKRITILFSLSRLLLIWQ